MALRVQRQKARAAAAAAATAAAAAAAVAAVAGPTNEAPEQGQQVEVLGGHAAGGRRHQGVRCTVGSAGAPHCRSRG